jgi:hypothetical protein
MWMDDGRISKKQKARLKRAAAISDYRNGQQKNESDVCLAESR